MSSTLNVHKSSLQVALHRGETSFVLRLEFCGGQRCVCAILQAIEVLDATASTCAFSLSDMITIFHARARYKFRFVTV